MLSDTYRHTDFLCPPTNRTSRPTLARNRLVLSRNMLLRQELSIEEADASLHPNTRLRGHAKQLVHISHAMLHQIRARQEAHTSPESGA